MKGRAMSRVEDILEETGGFEIWSMGTLERDFMIEGVREAGR